MERIGTPATRVLAEFERLEHLPSTTEPEMHHASLAEGLEDCLTVAELRLTPKLRQALSSTNVIESGFSIVDQICDQVKRWQGSDHRLRWIGSALLFAESRWNRIHDYRHMPVLITALKTAYAVRRGENQIAFHAELNAA